MKASELRIGNYLEMLGKVRKVECISNLPARKEMYWLTCENMIDTKIIHFHPIQLSEEWLLKFGFSVINENSAGKRYGYVINGIYSSDLTFTFWRITKEAGKFFRSNLELKHVHQLQNLYFALTGEELTLKTT